MHSDVFWRSYSSSNTYLVSRDDGATYRNETLRKLWGSYFFVSDIIRTHSRYDFSLIDFFCQLGGLIQFLFITFFILPNWLNTLKLENKAMNQLYIEEESGSGVVKSVNMSLGEAFLHRCSCLKRHIQSSHRIKEGLARMKEDLNLIRIVQDLYKLRAGMMVLAERQGEHEEFEQDVKEKYLKMVSLGNQDSEC